MSTIALYTPLFCLMYDYLEEHNVTIGVDPLLPVEEVIVVIESTYNKLV